MAYLALPVLVMIAFSFNDRRSLEHPLAAASRSTRGSTRWAVRASRTRSSTACIDRVPGDDDLDDPRALIGLALVRYSFRGRGVTNLLIFLPMATPEIVLGTSLLTIFLQLPGLFYPLGVHTILIAHMMFYISFVVVTIKARLQGFPRHLEEAAMDLGANEWTTFWRVTFPLILPGVMAAALLAFSLSIDDYVVTSFTAGQTPHLPALHLRLAAARHPRPGQRHRHDHLRAGGGASWSSHHAVPPPAARPGGGAVDESNAS